MDITNIALLLREAALFNCVQVCHLGYALPLFIPAITSRYLRGLMDTFNEQAEKLMDKLVDVADNEAETETNMLKLLNCVTMDVIAKVKCPDL